MADEEALGILGDVADEIHFNVNPGDNNMVNNNEDNENNNVVCTPPCPSRHTFVDFPEYPALFR